MVTNLAKTLSTTRRGCSKWGTLRLPPCFRRSTSSRKHSRNHPGPRPLHPYLKERRVGRGQRNARVRFGVETHHAAGVVPTAGLVPNSCTMKDRPIAS